MLAPAAVRTVSVLFVLGFATTAWPEVVKTVDLRNQDVADDFYVILCARKSPSSGTGHAFIVWAQRDEGSSRSMAYGFYPGMERVLIRLWMGKGRMVDEHTKQASTNPDLLTHRLIVRVDRETFLKSVAVKEEWERSGYGFNLISRNCLHFSREVGVSLGLNPPPPKIGERASGYLGRVIQRTGGQDAIELR